MPSKPPQKKHQVATTTFVVILAIALLFDALQLGSDLMHAIPIVGNAAAIIFTTLLDLWAYLTFYFLFKINGVSFMKPKRALALNGGLLIELIPVLNSLPAWTLAVTIIFITTRGEEALAKTLEATAGVVGGTGKVAGMTSKVPGVGKNMKQGLAKVSEKAKDFSEKTRGEAERLRSSNMSGVAGNSAQGNLPTSGEKQTEPEGANPQSATTGQARAKPQELAERTPPSTAPQDIGAQPVFRQPAQQEAGAPKSAKPTFSEERAKAVDERANTIAENISRTNALQQGVSPEKAAEETRKRNQTSIPSSGNSAPKRPTPPPLPPSTPPQTPKPQTGQPTNGSRIPPKNKGATNGTPATAPAPVNHQPTTGQPLQSPPIGQTSQSAPSGQTSPKPETAPNQASVAPAVPATTPTKPEGVKQPTTSAPRATGPSALVPPPAQGTPSGQTAKAGSTSSSESPKSAVAPRSEPQKAGQSSTKPSAVDRPSSGQGSSVPQTPISTALRTSSSQTGTPQRRGNIRDSLKDLGKARERNQKELKETLRQVLNAAQKGKKLP